MSEYYIYATSQVHSTGSPVEYRKNKRKCWNTELCRRLLSSVSGSKKTTLHWKLSFGDNRLEFLVGLSKENIRCRVEIIAILIKVH